MAWAQHRRTVRVEDEAYCVLGLFDVNMPVLYGEGSRAFRRLEEEIQKANSSAILGTLDTSGMRLLVARSDPLEIKNISAIEDAAYAILSHTWGQDEVSFQDLATGKAENRLGYWKIRICCEQAVADGFEYVWVDTCCIDKTSSAELQEAICSMYKWYKGAQVCYAYLDDSGAWGPESRLSSCRWFRRGWTLQELIAPTYVEFYDETWNEIGTKQSLCEPIAQLTGIDPLVLRGADPTKWTVAERMSWAGGRSTSRIEDKAYSLMGLFNVFMPMLYGEGNRAFIRLQEEIIRQSEDYTIFAWRSETVCPGSCGMFAESPASFILPEGSPARFIDSVERGTPPVLTSRGLHISLPLVRIKDTHNTYSAWICNLKSPLGDNTSTNQSLVCVRLIEILGSPRKYVRQSNGQLEFRPARHADDYEQKIIYVLPSGAANGLSLGPLTYSKSGKIRIHIDGEAEVNSSTVSSPYLSERATLNSFTNVQCNLFFDKTVQILDYDFHCSMNAGIWTLATVRYKTFLVCVGFREESPWCSIIVRPEFLPHLLQVPQLSQDGHGRDEMIAHYKLILDYMTPDENVADRALIHLPDASIVKAKIKVARRSADESPQQFFHLYISHTGRS